VLLAAGVVLDTIFGVSTAGAETLESAGLWAVGYCDYEPTPWFLLRTVMRTEHVGPGDVFVDLGSGKGRVVLEAARMPFDRVVGIEFHPGLHATALANIDAYRGRRRARSVELSCGDAAMLPLPDDATHVYLFNPFLGDVAERAFLQIAASLRRRPRSIRLYYLDSEGDAELRRVFPDAVRRVRRRGYRDLTVYDIS
jgi:SAM-dependent methyltransferase